MNRPVLWLDEAEQDLADAVAWYDRIRPALGHRFLNEIRDSIARVEFMPEMFAKVHQDIRRCRVRRFPYGLFYREFVDKIEVIALMHNRRDPMIWQRRSI